MGYLKLRCSNTIFPSTDSNVVPELSLESIKDLRSSIANTDAVADFAFAESGARELYWVIPTAAKLRAKKAYKAHKTMKQKLSGEGTASKYANCNGL